MKREMLTILGAGFAGMSAALVLSPYFDEVQVIDRYWVDEDRARGIPQSTHLHVLLAQGQRRLEALLPAIWDDLLGSDLPEVDWGLHTFWQTPFGLFPLNETGITTRLMSRSLINQTLMQHLRSCKNVMFIKGSIISHEEVDGRHLIRTKGGDTFQCKGFLIDARGRGVLRGGPMKEVLNQYHYDSTVLAGDQYELSLPIRQVNIQPDPITRPVGFVLSPIEGDRAVLTVIDTRGRQSDKFDKYETVRNLLEQNRLGTLRDGPSEWHPFANLSNRRRIKPFNKAMPNSFILGDAACYQNPVYGQGMSVALHQIECVKRSVMSSSRRGLQRKLEETLRLPWMVATSEDLKYQRSKSLKTKAINRFFAAVVHAATHDEVVHRAFLSVLHQLSSPAIFFKPHLLTRIL